jgi:cytochrome c-type biogenesis protein CcmH/NrfF
MALAHFVIWQPPLKTDTSGHWFMMQVGMIVGYFTAWPVNRRLVRSGIKEKMDHRKHLAMLVERRRRRHSRLVDEPRHAGAIARYPRRPDSW